MSDRIEHPIRALLLDPDGEPTDDLHTVWRYDKRHPYAVAVEFDHQSTWTFARSLVADGVVVPAGLGDVRFTPEDGMVRVDLTAEDDQTAAIVFEASDLQLFVAEVFDLVPEGAEQADIDAGIALLLSPKFRSAVR